MGINVTIRNKLRTLKRKLHYIKTAEAYHVESENRIKDLEERLQWFKDHAEITTLKPATGYLRKKQLDLITFTDSFFEEISDLNIKPFLICGNLIGAYRHKGYVPWDDDLDFGLLRQDYEKLIDYCKNNYYVSIYNGRWSEYSNDKHIARMDKLVKDHPNEYILDIWHDQLQIMKGTSCIDRLAVDFWAFDYYSEDYSIEDHKDYLLAIDKKKHDIDYIDKIVQYLNNEIKNNPKICREKTSKVFPGIDNVEGYLRIKRTKDWLYTDMLLPLKKSKYEETEYYVPNNMEKWLDYEYPDFMLYPTDVGVNPHEGYKEKYIINNLPTVEFYLIDSFEIYHFLPLYFYFEKNGIYSSFIAEKPDSPEAWFDYDEAIKVLEVNGVRYKTEPDFNSDYVFTTQDEYLIGKYKHKKIHLCYGVSLTSYSFCESDRTINGFDLKIVHGDYSYEVVKQKNPNLRTIKAGYLRYSEWGKKEYIYDTNEKKELIFQKNNKNKKVLLYFPTWDKASSINKYASGFKKLRDDFFIITKAHHCTFRLETEKEHMEILNEISDIILEGNFSFDEAAKLGDIAICDAISGSATEVPFVNHNIRLILLNSPIEEKNQYKGFIDDYAFRASDSEELVEAVYEIYQKDEYLDKRNNILNGLYFNNTAEGLKEIKEYIYNNCEKKG